jgi:hypothetical protein
MCSNTNTLVHLKRAVPHALRLWVAILLTGCSDLPQQRSIDALNACAKADITKVSFTAYAL